MANKMKCVNALNRASFISTSKAIANPLEIQSVNALNRASFISTRCRHRQFNRTEKCVNALNRASFISTLAFWNSLFKWLLRN